MSTQPAIPPLEAEVPAFPSLVSGLMKARGFNMRSLAAQMTGSQSASISILKGQLVRIPAAEQLTEIALALGVEPSVLHHAAARDYGFLVGLDTDMNEDERTLIDAFRRMPARMRGGFVGMARDSAAQG